MPLTGFRFDQDGTATALSREEILRLPRRPPFRVWIDVQGTDLVDLSVLSMVFQFHPLAIDDCLKQLHHPKVEEFEDHLFLIIRGLDFQQNQEKFRTTKLACFLGEEFLVTFHRVKLKSVDAMRERCAQDSRLGTRGPDYVLHGILDQMVDQFFPEIEQFEKAVDGLQERVIRNPTRETLLEILRYKRSVFQLRRFAGPQREVLSRLARGEFRYIRPANHAFYRDVFDHTFRIWDAIDNQRDMLVSLMETHLSVSSNRLNEVMKVLTLITTIILPVSLIASIYGMNFKNMPEIEWEHGYLFAWGLMAAVGIGMWYFFRHKKWL